MKKLYLSCVFLMAVYGSSAAMGVSDYREGIVVVNESQYGKGSGTLNFLQPGNETDFWRYRVFREVNPGRELGCTPCYGAYHDGKLYVVSKLDKDPASAATGGIVTVMDGATLQWKGQINALDPSGARVCGRAFLGIDAGKGYVSSSNGIWAIDLRNLLVIGQVAGSENPNGTDNKPVGDPTSAIYFGQCGAMVLAEGKVFAAHQSKGVLVIDPVSDNVERVITMDCAAPDAMIGSIVKSKDGSLWCSVTGYDGDYDYYTTIDKLVRINPSTLETSVVDLPEGIYGPSTSWAAWSADTFRASRFSNEIYWTGGADNWFANMEVFRFDVDAETATRIMDFNDDEDQWKVCCPSLGIDPSDGSLYLTLFKDVVSTQYMVRNCLPDGTPVRDYPMERAYWFPGLFLFPASDIAGIETVDSHRDACEMEARYENGFLTLVLPWREKGGDEVVVRISDLSGRSVGLFHTGEKCCRVAVELSPGIYVVSAIGDAVKVVVR